MIVQRLGKAIRAYYLAPPEIAFRQFRAGLIYFATGLGTVLLANGYMEPSVQQELVVLGGVTLGGIGFVIALIGQSRFLFGRLRQFWLRNR